MAAFQQHPWHAAHSTQHSTWVLVLSAAARPRPTSEKAYCACPLFVGLAQRAVEAARA
jgi:hypothetical protein